LPRKREGVEFFKNLWAKASTDPETRLGQQVLF